MARQAGRGGSGGEEALRAMDALRRVVRVLRVSSRAVTRDVGISGAQLFVLRQLALAPGQSVNDLAARTLTRQSTVSEVVGRLVARGLVSRRAAPDDARRAVLSLTTRGQRAVSAAPPTVQGSLVEAFDRLAGDEQQALADGLEAWLAEAGLADVPPTMFFELSPMRAPRRGRGTSAQPDGGADASR